ncbi:hypothetical protein Tco_0279556, partial [Tanacetum coccineum]
MQIDNSRQSSSRFRQTADRAATDSDRCISQNYKNTEINKSRLGRQQTEKQQTQADSSQTADSDSRHQIQRRQHTADRC